MEEAVSPRILVPSLRDAPDVSALGTEEGWKSIRAAAIAYRMAGFVAFAMRGEVTGEKRAWCDQVLTENWARHDSCIRRLDSVLEILDAAKVETLVLKGPVVGRRHYQPAFLRPPSKDIDLAVRDRDLERAVEALSAHGYSPNMSLRSVRSTDHHVAMSQPGRASVELHIRLSHNAIGIPVERFFGRAGRHDLPTGRTVGILSPADEILGLMLHLSSERFASFFHLYELRQIWRGAAAGLREEVLDMAVRDRYAATAWLVDAAFQTYWGDHFIPPGKAVPKPWLHGRLNAGLLSAMEQNMVTPDRSLGVRIKGRWLDLQVTDGPVEVARSLGLMWRVGVRQLGELRRNSA